MINMINVIQYGNLNYACIKWTFKWAFTNKLKNITSGSRAKVYKYSSSMSGGLYNSYSNLDYFSHSATLSKTNEVKMY